MIKKFIATVLGLLLGLFLFAVGLVTIAVLNVYPKLPDLQAIQQYQPKEPLTIYSAEGAVIGTYGDERRTFTTIDQFPQHLKDAVIAAEDKRFYHHWGVDLMGIARAVLSNIQGGAPQGASTITQQVARNFYLTNERTLTRKFNEALLAYKIEKHLTKDQILELYFNQIYLGQRAYGFAAAAKIYFNKEVRDLNLAEATILAGLPKAPSAFNPVVNPERARLRQEYILNNMVELNMITPVQRTAALAESLVIDRHRVKIDPNSLYVAEMARQYLYERYGEAAYTQGLHVYTTVSIKNQEAATQALRKALRNFDKGSAYRGAEQQFDLSQVQPEEWDEELEQLLSNTHTVEGMVPAIITRADKTGIGIYLQGGQKFDIAANNMGMARNAIGNKKLGDAALKVGSMIRVYKGKGDQSWRVVQQPLIQGAIVSIDADTGAIRAMVGGYDFHNKAFNRATQSIRQPGSTFKPFIYSAAIAKGLSADSLVNDAPITIGGWSPKNFGGYSGMITLRTALTYSKNTVSVRILQAMGVKYGREYAQRFGFRPDQLPNGLSLSLGSGSATPLQMAEGYAVFANGGYKVSGYVIDKIYDSQGNLRAQMEPLVAKQNAPQVIDPRNAYVMTSMMRDVIQHGTATRANILGRKDLAGKTGTTNDSKDAWFVGFSPKIVTAVYVGYDTPKSMGQDVQGGRLALPIWIDYMRFALQGMKPTEFQAPAGVVQQNGEVVIEGQRDTISRAIDNTTDNPAAVQPVVPLQSNDVPQDAAVEQTPRAPVESGRTNGNQRGNANAIDELF